MIGPAPAICSDWPGDFYDPASRALFSKCLNFMKKNAASFHFALLALCSAKCEIKSLNVRIEEFDLEGAVLYLAFLTDQLVKTRLPSFPGTIRTAI